MRVTQEEKERTHQKIVVSAARLLRERGVEGASVADVMAAAGLTHGGFYRHFDTKDEMVVAALDSAFAQILAMIDQYAGRLSAVGSLEAFTDLYLSDGHVGNPGLGCPVAAVSQDVARASTAVRVRFSDGVRCMVEALARAGKGGAAQRNAQAYRQLAMIAGAVMIARASDGEVARDVLAACRASKPTG